MRGLWLEFSSRSGRLSSSAIVRPKAKDCVLVTLTFRDRAYAGDSMGARVSDQQVDSKVHSL